MCTSWFVCDWLVWHWFVWHGFVTLIYTHFVCILVCEILVYVHFLVCVKQICGTLVYVHVLVCVTQVCVHCLICVTQVCIHCGVCVDTCVQWLVCMDTHLCALSGLCGHMLVCTVWFVWTLACVHCLVCVDTGLCADCLSNICVPPYPSTPTHPPPPYQILTEQTFHPTLTDTVVVMALVWHKVSFNPQLAVPDWTHSTKPSLSALSFSSSPAVETT